jgi:hypothetical protein
MLVLRTPGLDKSAREAMRALGARRDADYVAWARSKIVERTMLDDRAEQFGALLASLPPAGEALKPCLKPLADLVSDLLLKRPDVAASAIKAYSAVRSEKAVIDQLIAWLEKAEEERGGGGGGSRGGQPIPPIHAATGGAGAPDPQVAKDEILAALARLTGGDATNGPAWKSWWASHKATFKPEPVRAAEPEWAKLTEFEDDTYAFVLKRCADKRWAFDKCPVATGRVRMECRGAAVPAARVDVLTYPKGTISSAAAFAQRLDAQWRKSEFTDFFADGEPKVTSKQIGGREFAVIAARGVAAGAWKDWDGCERRTYVTAAGAGAYLAFEAVVRTGAEESVRAALWAQIEGMTFTDAR